MGSDILLIFHVLFYHRQPCSTNRGHEITISPQRGQTRFECGKFLPQIVRGNAFQILDEPMYPKLRVHFDQNVYMVGHDFQSAYFGSESLTPLVQNVPQPKSNLAFQN
jgi:hypothetical protein